MQKSFSSVVELCDHIKTVPNMSAYMSHANKGDTKDLSFLYVSFKKCNTMWTVVSERGPDNAPSLSIKKSLDSESYPAATPEQLSVAIKHMVRGLK